MSEQFYEVKILTTLRVPGNGIAPAAQLAENLMDGTDDWSDHQDSEIDCTEVVAVRKL